MVLIIMVLLAGRMFHSAADQHEGGRERQQGLELGVQYQQVLLSLPNDGCMPRGGVPRQFQHVVSDLLSVFNTVPKRIQEARDGINLGWHFVVDDLFVGLEHL